MNTLIAAMALFAAAPQFIETQADRANYAANDKAVFTTYVKTQPANPNYEIFLDAKLDTQAIKVVRISDDEAASISPSLSAGSHHYEINAYLQDKQYALDLSATIAFYKDEICTLQHELDSETDPERIAQLQAQISRDQDIVTLSNQQLADNRTLLETKTADIQVSALHSVAKALTDDLMLIESDHAGANYQVGQSATLTTHVLTAFAGPDGPQEIVLRSKLDTTDLGVTNLTEKDFRSTTAVFLTGDVGRHEFKSRLFTRSKARSDSLRTAISKASERRADFIALRDQTSDSAKKAYYQHQIDDLTMAIDEFYNQLEAGLTFIQEKSFFITVETIQVQHHLINFDNLPHDTIVTDQYAPAHFAAESGAELRLVAGSFGSSVPNFACPVTIGNTQMQCNRSVNITFDAPVQNAQFRVVASQVPSGNDFADVTAFSGDTLLGTVSVISTGDPMQPIAVDLSAFHNVTRIYITGGFWNAFDDLSFDTE